MPIPGAAPAQGKTALRALLEQLRVDEVRETEVLILGSGAAGLQVALACADQAPGEAVTTLLTKGMLVSGSSPAAQGGIAAAIGSGDDWRQHAADTLRAGRGLCDPEVVRVLTEAAPRFVARLRELGTRFDQSDGGLALGREAGHGRSRVLHAGGDRTGAELVRALARAVRRSGVRIEERLFAVDLLLAGSDLKPCVAGVYALRERPGQAPRRVAYLADAVILATGGLGQIYRYTTNPAEVTGDGVAMAARAGAELADLELVQFHPTALLLPGASDAGGPAPLLTEALRGAGARLLDERGERFMSGVHPDAELAPRDVVARALFEHRRRGHQTLLDARALGAELASRFPNLVATCTSAGIDPRRQPIPVGPAAHYAMGGVAVDAWGRSSLDGLWACGETASNGAHGANRLASNSLLDCLVMGARVGLSVGRTLAGEAVGRPALGLDSLRVVGGRTEPRPLPRGAAEELRRRLREATWQGAGVARTADGLVEALAELEAIRQEVPASAAEVDSRSLGELRNLCLVARLVAWAALGRPESRGCHYRVDHPESRPGFEHHLGLRLPPGSEGDLLPRLERVQGAVAAESERDTA